MLKINITYVSATGYRKFLSLGEPNSTDDILNLYLLDDGHVYTEDKYKGIVLDIDSSNYMNKNYLEDIHAKGGEESEIITKISNKEIEFKDLDIKYRKNKDIITYALISDAKNINHLPNGFMREIAANRELWATIMYHNFDVLYEYLSFNELVSEVAAKSHHFCKTFIESNDVPFKKDRTLKYFNLFNASLFTIVNKHYSISKEDLLLLIPKNPSIYFYLEDKFKKDNDVYKVFLNGLCLRLSMSFEYLLKKGIIKDGTRVKFGKIITNEKM